MVYMVATNTARETRGLIFAIIKTRKKFALQIIVTQKFKPLQISG